MSTLVVATIGTHMLHFSRGLVLLSKLLLVHLTNIIMTRSVCFVLRAAHATLVTIKICTAPWTRESKLVWSVSKPNPSLIIKFPNAPIPDVGSVLLQGHQ